MEFDLESCLAWPILLLYLSKWSLLPSCYTVLLGSAVHRPLYDRVNAGPCAIQDGDQKWLLTVLNVGTTKELTFYIKY